MKLAVIIINYRTPGLIIQCLESLIGQLIELNARAVVVDNCSGDNSVEALKVWLSVHAKKGFVQLVESSVNAGFSAGNNIGIQTVAAEYYLLLNSDTIVRPCALAVLAQTADKNPD